MWYFGLLSRKLHVLVVATNLVVKDVSCRYPGSVGTKLIATWARENHFCQNIYLLSSTNNFVNQKISGYKVVETSLIYRFHTKSFTSKGVLIAGRRVETLPRCS